MTISFRAIDEECALSTSCALLLLPFYFLLLIFTPLTLVTAWHSNSQHVSWSKPRPFRGRTAL